MPTLSTPRGSTLVPCSTSTPAPCNALPSNWVSFKIVGDNIDKNVQPRFMRVDASTRSLHYFHAYAVKDKSRSLFFFRHITQLALPLSVDDLCSQILPSPEDYDTLSDNFATHIFLNVWLTKFHTSQAISQEQKSSTYLMNTVLRCLKSQPL